VVAIGGARIAVLLVAALVLTVQPDTAALASRANLSSWGRSEAARAALDLIAEHPLIGAGVGQARFVWDLPDGNGEIALYAHNEYLQLLVDLGAIGAVLLLALLAAIAVVVKRGWNMPHAAGALAGLAALAVHSGFDFLWHIPVLPLLAGLFIGLTATSRSEEEQPNQPRGAP
jgi:O-antigen ligase